MSSLTRGPTTARLRRRSATAAAIELDKLTKKTTSAHENRRSETLSKMFSPLYTIDAKTINSSPLFRITIMRFTPAAGRFRRAAGPTMAGNALIVKK